MHDKSVVMCRFPSTVFGGLSRKVPQPKLHALLCWSGESRLRINFIVFKPEKKPRNKFIGNDSSYLKKFKRNFLLEQNFPYLEFDHNEALH